MKPLLKETKYFETQLLLLRPSIVWNAATLG